MNFHSPYRISSVPKGVCPQPLCEVASLGVNERISGRFTVSPGMEEMSERQIIVSVNAYGIQQEADYSNNQVDVRLPLPSEKGGIGEPVWTWRTNTWVNQAPVIKGGRLYVGSDNLLYSIDQATGEETWNYAAIVPTQSYWTGIPVSLIAASNKAVYFTVEPYGGESYLYSVDSVDGNANWRYQFTGRAWSAPVVAGQRVYVGAYDPSGEIPTATLYSLNASSGTLNWQRPIEREGKIYISEVSNGRIYAVTQWGDLYSFNAASGRLNWRIAEVWSSEAPLVFNGNLYVSKVSQNTGILYSINPASGRVKWSYEYEVGNCEVRDCAASLVGHEGHIYISFHRADHDWLMNLHMIDASSGQLEREFLMANAATAFDRGKVYLHYRNPCLFELNTGDWLWCSSLAHSRYISVESGLLYVATNNEVIAFAPFE